MSLWVYVGDGIGVCFGVLCQGKVYPGVEVGEGRKGVSGWDR